MGIKNNKKRGSKPYKTFKNRKEKRRNKRERRELQQASIPAPSPGDLVLMLHARDGLLEVPQQVVDVSELAVSRALGSRDVELVGHDEALLVAHERLLEVPDAPVGAPEAAVGSLLVPRAFGLEGDGEVLWAWAGRGGGIVVRFWLEVRGL